jgi:hypothetical protein
MPDNTMGFPEAAHRLGVPLRILRAAIRAGRIPAPPKQAATVTLSAEWFDSAQAAFDAAPKALNRSFQQKVAPFARYEGTSCWRKYRVRVREYYAYKARTVAA